ncbi:MAG: caspase family protein [Gemmataceae bacterium]
MSHRIALAAVLALAGSVGAQTKYALLIGVGKYDPAQLTGLPFAEADVTDLAKTLTTTGGYKPEHVVLMTQAGAARDLSLAPESNKIRTKLAALVKLAEPGDTLLVGFAGHGVQFANQPDNYFCPADANLEDRRTLLSLGDVYTALKSSRAGLKLLLVDACRNDPRAVVNRAPTVKLESVSRPQSQVPPGGVAAFFSCSAGEKAFESPDLKHGVFFHYIIEAFQGKAADTTGLVTVPDLEKYVKPKVKTYVFDKFAGAVQRPEMNNQTVELLPLVGVKPAVKPKAPLKLAGVFGDGMVLQRDVEVPVWGTAEPGETVTVRLGGQRSPQVPAKVGPDGRWLAKLQPQSAAAQPRVLFARCGSEELRCSNVLVGEVWLVAGQANVETPLRDTADGAKVAESATFPQVRVLSVAKTASLTPQTDMGGTWVSVAPAVAGHLSAVAFYFARDLHKAMGVPVGIIEASQTDGRAQTWISRPALQAEPALKEYGALVGPRPGRLAMTPTGNFNGMIAPLIPFAIRGAVWQHGGSNASKPSEYGKLLQTLINDWRQQWGKVVFPFLVVQMHSRDLGAPGAVAELREGQAKTAAGMPKVGLVVATDLGESKVLAKMEPIGQRLALQARAVAYGEKVVATGPTYKSHAPGAQNRARIMVTFDNTGGGLEAHGGKLVGFELCGADKVFHPADATIGPRGERILLTSDKVPSPIGVRYNWANVTAGNLFNKEGLPAAPFRTEER